MTTPPAKPYIFRFDGQWVVQWTRAGGVRRLRLASFREACRMAATIRRWQLRGER